MNKQFLVILVLALVSQINGMDKELYPHDYDCKRNWFQGKHHFNEKFPVRFDNHYLLNALNSPSGYDAYELNEQELRAFYQFVDGKAPLVVATKAFYEAGTTELEELSSRVASQCDSACRTLGRPRGYQGEYIAEKDTLHWRNLRERLAHPKFEWIQTKLEQFPELWKALEKTALTANIVGNKRPTRFKMVLLPAIAKLIDVTEYAQSVFYLEELAKKDTAINQEREAKEAAQREHTTAHNNFVAERLIRNQLQLSFNAEQAAKNRLQEQLNERQQASDAIAAELRRLEPNKDTYLRTLAQKMGEAVYTSHQQQIPLDAGAVQALAERRLNPPAEQMQAHERDLSNADLNPLFELLIKKAQVDPQNAKALLISAMAKVRFATSDVYVQLIQKLRADVTRLAQEKAELTRNYAAAIATTGQQANQIDRRAAHAFHEFARELSPLRRELPVLRDQVREQDIEIRALRSALGNRNQP